MRQLFVCIVVAAVGCGTANRVASAEDAKTVPQLIEALKAPAAADRARAARALAKLGSAAKPAAESLTAMLKDEDATVRRQAVRAIVAIHPGPEVMIPLFVKAMEGADSGVQIRMLDAVTDAGAAAVPGLIKALDNEKAAYWACIVLRNLGPVAKDAVPALTRQLSSKQLEIPREAALALGAIGADAASALPQLANALDNPQACEAATFAIGQIGKMPEGAAEKIRAQANGKDPMLGTISYWTLARTNPQDKTAVEAAAKRLVAALDSEHEFVRQIASRGLASLPPMPSVTLPLIESVNAKGDEKRCALTLATLAAIGPSAVPQLIDLLKYKSLQADVAIILGHQGEKASAAVEPLAKLLAADDKRVAVESALALANIGPEAKSAVSALAAELAKKDRPNLHAVIFALGRIGPGATAAEDNLHHLAASKDHSVAAIAAWAVTRLHPTSEKIAAKAIPIIEAALRDPLPETRRAAVESLGSIGPMAKAALPALEKSSHDSSAAVRTAAAKAIQAIKTSN